MVRYNIIVRLAALGKKQVDIIRELRKRGIKVAQAEMSRYIHGVDNPPKSELVLAEADKILTEWEAETDAERKRALS